MVQNQFLPGFDDPVIDSQTVFRAALKALSRPGLILDIPVLPPAPGPLYPAATALALTFFDLDSPLWLDSDLDVDQVREYLRFHCGARFTDDPGRAAFGLIGRGESFSGLNSFNQGDPGYPDQSTTVIIQVDDFGPEKETILSGPGINGRTGLSIKGLSRTFWTEFAVNHSGFPLGVDCFLVSPRQICGLPRSTRVEAGTN